ncbi:MAG: DUF1501 domain-containing protein [Gemmatimonadales bacterium]|nr:DUF1501 domain-containing protein [Gemmatimonadota bacterium]MCL4213901.1 DUF1501 domain-containing protein [Gemmatimonadales bacterium]
MHRRVFVRSGALALVTMGLSPSFLRRTAFGLELPRAAKGKVLICLFQRGAADALNVVVPFGDAEYFRLRPNIAIPRPARSAGENGSIDLDGFFGLHPALSPLAPLWKRGMLAPIHAVGSPSATRSHFDAQDYMESGTPDVKGTRDGWLNRYLATCDTCEAGAAKSPFRAVAMTPQTPRILQGPSPAVAMNSLDAFTVRSAGGMVERLEALYRTGSADLVHATGAETFDAVKMLREANPQRYQPEHGAEYPRSEFGQRLRQIAQLIKAGVGLEVAFADVGGWDTHVNQGGATGQLANRLGDFARSIAALVTDLGDRMDDVVILTMSEFGRMARQNGNGGTDHGHAGSMFAIGGSVRGGRVLGRWPGLAREQLYEGRDLALTTDFRTVFGEVVRTHLGAPSAAPLFPGFANAASVGLFG